MVRLFLSVSLVSLGAFAFLDATALQRPPEQRVQFNHKLHLEHLKDGSHVQLMIAVHHELLMKALEDEEIVADIIESVKEGNCTLCHGDFDENVGVDVEETARLHAMARLHACEACHRVMLEHDWEGRLDQQPCAGCHNGAVRSERASIPNIDVCIACHPRPTEGHASETTPSVAEAELLEFIEREETIDWVQVHDYVPSEIIFSHERHVEFGRVRCQECHGEVEKAEKPLSLKVELSMEDCMDCHEKDHKEHERLGEVSWADNDCLACHR